MRLSVIPILLGSDVIWLSYGLKTGENWKKAAILLGQCDEVRCECENITSSGTFVSPCTYTSSLDRQMPLSEQAKNLQLCVAPPPPPPSNFLPPLVCSFLGGGSGGGPFSPRVFVSFLRQPQGCSTVEFGTVTACLQISRCSKECKRKECNFRLL